MAMLSLVDVEVIQNLFSHSHCYYGKSEHAADNRYVPSFLFYLKLSE